MSMWFDPPSRFPLRYHANRYRGVTSALSMIYLVLFSTLAIGFYATVNTSIQVSDNEKRGTNALLAA